MKLNFDRRESLKKEAPATHALIVGISRYGFLPAQAEGELVQLSTAAQSAYTFYQWLDESRDELSVPLATCRVMLAPSDAEVVRIPALKELAGPCTVSDFVAAASEWRRDALGNKDNALLLYFAGHSLEPSEANPLLMFDDFGDGVGPALRATVPLTNLIDGLAPSDWQREIGRQQFLFIDTDRLPPIGVPPESLRRPTEAFDVARRSPFDDRRSCVLYGTTPGGLAFTFADSVTFFNQSLLTCLRGSAAVPSSEAAIAPTEWSVTTRSLARGVQAELDELKRENVGEQRIAWSIQGDDAVLVRIRKPPRVILRLWIDPPELRSKVRFAVYNDEDEKIIDEAAQTDARPEWPIKIDCEAGIYRVALSLGATGANPVWQSTVTFTPPRVEVQARIKT